MTCTSVFTGRSNTFQGPGHLEIINRPLDFILQQIEGNGGSDFDIRRNGLRRLALFIRHADHGFQLQTVNFDAVFSHAPRGQIQRGETLAELLETTYTAFRDHIRGIVHRTTCECNACRAIPLLDLKFIVHFGNYVMQEVAGIRELVGSEVNRLFRLGKNHVTEETGWNAYILYTDASLQESGIAAPSYTTLNGEYCLRAAIANHRSKLEDFDLMVDAVINLGKNLM